jgi:hypothetical protein
MGDAVYTVVDLHFKRWKYLYTPVEILGKWDKIIAFVKCSKF